MAFLLCDKIITITISCWNALKRQFLSYTLLMSHSPKHKLFTTPSRFLSNISSTLLSNRTFHRDCCSSFSIPPAAFQNKSFVPLPQSHKSEILLNLPAPNNSVSSAESALYQDNNDFRVLKWKCYVAAVATNLKHDASLAVIISDLVPRQDSFSATISPRPPKRKSAQVPAWQYPIHPPSPFLSFGLLQQYR